MWIHRVTVGDMWVTVGDMWIQRVTCGYTRSHVDTQGYIG